MHPIPSSSSLFGPSGIKVQFNNGTGIVTGSIVDQIGTSRYVVTDGTANYIRQLAQTVNDATNNVLATPVAPSIYPLCTVLVNGAGIGSGAVFLLNYEATGISIVNGGTAYAANDTLTLQNGATATVTAVNGSGVITGLAVAATGTFATPVTGTIVTTGGTGTGATVSLTYSLRTISATTGGSGYVAGQTLVFSGMTATTRPTVSISTVGANGAITALSIAANGTGITTVPASIIVESAAEHVVKLATNLLYTAEGNVYAYTPAAAGASNYAVLQTFS